MVTASYKVVPLVSQTPLSKSKFVHGVQCPLYVWLEVRTDLPRPEPDSFTQALFATGDEVGEYARQRWDARELAAERPTGTRITDDPQLHKQAVAETAAALDSGVRVIHEASFSYAGVKVRVDVLERLSDGTFALNEVKSTSKYDEKKHLLDAAVQLRVLRGAGLKVSRVNLVHLNKAYVWPGGDYDLERLFADEDITAPAESLQGSITVDVARLLRVLESDEMPVVPEDTDCSTPYACPYLDQCPARGESVDHPITEACKRNTGAYRTLTEAAFTSLLEIDEAVAREHFHKAGTTQTHEAWYTTWKATVSGERIVLEDCPSWVRGLVYPIYHLDFETLGPAIPAIPHTHPFEVVPLQYSVHAEYEDGSTVHKEFFAEADDPDPRATLVTRLLADLGESGTILRWSAYEKTVLSGLARNPRYAEYATRIDALIVRMEDLGKAVSDWVFDPGFHGRWSIKVVYPVLVPGGDADAVRDENPVLTYDDLDGCAKGDEAAMLLLEYVRPETAQERRLEIRRQMLQYCKLDTWAMVEVLRAIRADCATRR